jgi:hypothetical protein
MRRTWFSLVLAASLVGFVPGVAQAAHHYANCTALHRDHPHGVARSRAAANAEVADGYGRPVVNRPLYIANSNLDANHDGVACER